MAFAVVRRVFLLRSTTNSLLSSQRGRLSTQRASTFVDDDSRRSVADRIQLSPLFQETGEDGIKDCKIELVDDSTWNVSSGLADAWRGRSEAAAMRMRSRLSDREHDDDEGVVGPVGEAVEDLGFDEIEDMRIRGKLFYKLNRSSKEYEEHKFDFHGRKSARNERDWKGSSKEDAKKEASNSKKDHVREREKSEGSKHAVLLSKNSTYLLRESSTITANKKQRTPTLNQLTAPYHELFCLDVFISKGSVRACIVHRTTSNVVAVAHSISKDMKFDLGSTKNKDACAAVGRILAQRALDDDIHNVVFTPRKGERVEGKLQIVVKSIVAGGVDVKVKLKQRSFKLSKHLRKTQNLHSLVSVIDMIERGAEGEIEKAGGSS
ncbi:uncharacterized protein LOC121777450 isoform X1 [Salvia splendens]|uniref:uncharacterized protein LOC121777450 isoform X1 n=1 Tax=Salvia splendens TaxID=180675 RepID=UPI001C25208B|nr:uncharacterized protein LOC121777450 isoform X1 [Salvia splendens]